MRQVAIGVVLASVLAGCATQEVVRTVDTRSENVGHQRLAANGGNGGPAQVEAYALAAGEGYRMPQLYAGPEPVLGDRDPRRELAPTVICLQVVVDAEGQVTRSVPLLDRDGCSAGTEPANAPLLQAAQAAVAQWRYLPAAVCHYAPGQVPDNRGTCEKAERVQPVPVSLLYAFTFEIVRGQVRVHSQGR